MKIFPIGDQVLVELDAREKDFGDSGIARPQTAEDKPCWGTVVGVGPGCFATINGKQHWRPVTVERGQRVLVAWSTGHDLTIGGRHHVCIHEHGPTGNGDGGILAVDA